MTEEESIKQKEETSGNTFYVELSTHTLTFQTPPRYWSNNTTHGLSVSAARYGCLDQRTELS